MASRSSAIKNNLNDRMHEVGIYDQDLDLADIRAVNAFYDFTCLKCGAKPAISLDHVIPISKGGTNTKDNIQNFCVECNRVKGDNSTDYRAGRICPPDFAAPSAQPKESYKKHDWDLMEFEFVSTDLSTREIADKHSVSYSQLCAISSREQWVKKRDNFRGKLGADAIESALEQELDLRLEISRTTLDFLKLWRRQANRIGNQDLIKLLELGARASGLELDKRSVTIKDWRDAVTSEHVEDIQQYATDAAADYFEGDTGSDSDPGA